MNLSIIGTGYVGLVTGTCFADMGNYVMCIDVDKNKIKKLKSGKSTIYEPGLESLIKKNIIEKRLIFTNDLKKGIEFGEIIFLCLPTPQNGDGSADLNYILNTSKLIAKEIKSDKIIVLKSTVPIGTNEMVLEIFKSISKCIDYMQKILELRVHTSLMVLTLSIL